MMPIHRNERPFLNKPFSAPLCPCGLDAPQRHAGTSFANVPQRPLHVSS
jgi:hypothetical protein